MLVAIVHKDAAGSPRHCLRAGTKGTTCPPRPGRLLEPLPRAGLPGWAEEWAPLGDILSGLSPGLSCVWAGAEGGEEAIVGTLGMAYCSTELFPPQEEPISS